MVQLSINKTIYTSFKLLNIHFPTSLTSSASLTIHIYIVSQNPSLQLNGSFWSLQTRSNSRTEGIQEKEATEESSAPQADGGRKGDREEQMARLQYKSE